MFLRISSLLIFFLSLQMFSIDNSYAYSNEGLEHINPQIAVRLAKKAGLGISAHERAIKKQLMKLKKTNRKSFDSKLDNGIENSDHYQGYLLEIQDGLQKVEKAKLIAKYQIYRQVQKNWSDLKMTSLNVNDDSSFKKFSYNLIRHLNEHLNYRPARNEKDKDYHFEIEQWATATVMQNLKSIEWKIEFAHKHDDNKLEKGVEDIKIQDEDSLPMNDDTGDMDSAPDNQKR